MANLIVFGMAVVFALIGSKQRLLKAWMILINAVFSVYIALWGADFLAGSLSLFNEKSEAYKYLCLIGGSWVVLMFVFHAAEKQLMPNPEEYSFPPFFDFLGGLLCGGAGGGFKGAAEQNSRIQLSEKRNVRVIAGRSGNLAESVDAVFQNFKDCKLRRVSEVRAYGIIFAGDGKCAGHQSSSSSFSMVLKL